MNETSGSPGGKMEVLRVLLIMLNRGYTYKGLIKVMMAREEVLTKIVSLCFLLKFVDCN